MANLPKHTQLLDLKDLHARGIKFARPTVDKLVARGDFPKPVKLSERKSVWQETVINEWLAKKINA